MASWNEYISDDEEDNGRPASYSHSPRTYGTTDYGGARRNRNRSSWQHDSDRVTTSDSRYQPRGRGHIQHQISSENSSGRRGRGRGRGRVMTTDKLESLKDDDNLENIILELTSDRGGFELLLSSPLMTFNMISLVLSVVSKACSSQHKEGLKAVVQSLCTSPFIETHLVGFIKRLNSQEEIVNVTNSSIEIIDVITRRVPKYSEICLPCLQLLQKVLQQYRLSHLYPELEEERARLEAVIREKVRWRRQHGQHVEDEDPPDNYRDLQMYPSPHDDQWLEEPFLRQNKGKGAYSDLDTYLDVQFRLLREDYIQPLRRGIQKYRRLRTERVPNQMEDMWLYHDVHVICSVCNEDVDTRLKFDVGRVGRIRWQSTKRLIYGSLVCLSKDGFQTMLFAVVTNRTTRDLLKGIIEVRFEKDFDTVINIVPTDTFVMAETPAYFEAYRHVLKRLQDIEDDLPFQNYFVDCDTRINPPSYLNQYMSKYDMSSLGDPRYEIYLTSVPVFNTSSWPPLQVYNLNKVQLDAVKTALTKEVAIIQGPPGTGKTYTGLKIMEVLLNNSDGWPQDRSSNVILVVCYTNHALDQFLEGILSFHQDGIIRVGGRSSSDVLKSFNLKEIRQNRRKMKQRKRSVFENHMDCKNKMSKLKSDIDSVGCKLEASMLGILHEDAVRPYMAGLHYSSLTNIPRRAQSSVVISWLEFQNPQKPTESEAVRHAVVDRWTKAILVFVNHEQEDDTGSREENHVLNLDLVKRALLYKSWVLQFRKNLLQAISRFEATIHTDALGRRSYPPVLEKLKSQLQMSKNTILSDDHLRQFVPNPIYTMITTSETYSKCHEGSAVKVWLGASPFSFQDGVSEALQELEDENELTMRASEEADIITRQRFVDDTENLFVRRPRGSAVRMSSALSSLALDFSSIGNSDPGWQSAEEQVYLEHQKKGKKRLESILTGSPTMSDTVAQSIRNVWSITTVQRESLYRSWVKKYQLNLKSSIQEKEREYRQIAKRLKEVLQEENRDILAEADVIGMTTTGAAKHASVLQIVAPRIIVVEEAAEVLEAHIITTLNPKCQQLILIGDHQQLRPNPTVYDLAKRYNLDMSLFERLVKNELHHVTLEYQHRMRPEISILMKHIYPNLKDHDSVTKFDDVLGVDSNVFFISHEHEENHVSESKSKSNEHEAEYILALCKYLLQQGYEPSDITMLAAYTGQISLIKKLMGNNKDLFQDVRLTSVDNFQGEESKIILLSFVRSNETGSVGFLSTDNRVCVALSRAKVGMFAVGNFPLLARKSPLWANIVNTLESKNSIGQHLLLRCRNHPEMTIAASTASDFDQAPKGGCTEICGFKLGCAHTCKRTCHIADMKHLDHRCRESCRKVFVSCRHRCLKKCYQKCQRCTTIVTKTVPNCGHEIQIQCSLEPEQCTSLCQKPLPCGHLCKANCADCTADGEHDKCKELLKKRLKCGHMVTKSCYAALPKCKKPCEHRLECEHTCTRICGDCSILGHVTCCQEKITKTYHCGHTYRMACSKSKLLLRCPGNCGKELKCGHACQGKCDDCSRSAHVKCTVTVDVTLECGHVYQMPCHSSKMPYTCTRQCNKKLDCSHICKGKCTDCFGTFHISCDEVVRVSLNCGHTYRMKCHSSKKSYKCNKSCDKTLSCGHQCKGVCGDCSASAHKSCEEDAIVTLKCGHRYRVKCFNSKKDFACPKKCT